MPNRPSTPHRTMRIPADEWDAVKRQAEAEGATATDVVRRAIRAYLRVAAAVAVVALVAGCGTVGYDTGPAAKAAPWVGTHGLTEADVQIANGPVAVVREAAWPCELVMDVRVATAPGVDRGDVMQEFAYPLATLRALGYHVTVRSAPYLKSAPVPTKRGEVLVAVTSDPKDQPSLYQDGTHLLAVATPGEGDGRILSATIAVDGRDGIGGDVLLHEFGHVLGLDHQDGTVMQGTGMAPVTFGPNEVAAVSCI